MNDVGAASVDEIDGLVGVDIGGVVGGESSGDAGADEEVRGEGSEVAVGRGQRRKHGGRGD